ncbi:MAG: hypothetical protein IPL79_14885 [Myxococcales bacterium]|nr:hypothetical protein [Myxococcales bacterium]
MTFLGLAMGCGANSPQPVSGPPIEPPSLEEPNADTAAHSLGTLADDEGAQRVACANINLALANAPDTEAVFINVALFGPLEDTPPMIGETFEIDLSETPDALRVQYGSNLTVDVCDDTDDPAQQPVIQDEFLPISGTLVIEVTEQTNVSSQYRAQVSLVDVRFSEDTAPVTVDLGIETYGWLPG